MFSESAHRKVVPPVRVDPSGVAGPTKDQARGPHWRRSSRGLYVPVDVDSAVPEQRVIEAAAVIPEGGAITGWAALNWLGGRWFGGTTPNGTQRPIVIASAARDIRPQPGIRLCAERLDPADIAIVDGVPVTVAARSVFFEMRYAPTWRRGVAYVDMAAADDLVSIRELALYIARHPGWTGVALPRKGVVLADENSWSPPEVTMRLVWKLDADRPRPWCNRPVFDLYGRHLGTPDLIDPWAGVVGEYDGALHLKASAKSRDLDREEVFRSHGLEYVTMVAPDLRDPRAFIERLDSTYRRAERRPTSDRRWTLQQPNWWVDTSTVDARRALTPEQRDRFLRFRRL